MRDLIKTILLEYDDSIDPTILSYLRRRVHLYNENKDLNIKSYSFYGSPGHSFNTLMNNRDIINEVFDVLFSVGVIDEEIYNIRYDRQNSLNEDYQKVIRTIRRFLSTLN